MWLVGTILNNANLDYHLYLLILSHICSLVHLCIQADLNVRKLVGVGKILPVLSLVTQIYWIVSIFLFFLVD